MRTVNSISINSDYDEVFRLSADVKRWPEILRHYRWVKDVGSESGDPMVEMAALRGFWPVKWTSIQKVDQKARWIRYRHIGGATRGMYVEWSFDPFEGGVNVTIIHDLTLKYPIINSGLGKLIVGDLFVRHIADQTLRGIKKAAEVDR